MKKLITKFERYLTENAIFLKEIENATGLSRQSLIAIKKGRTNNMHPRTLRDLSDFCRISPEELLEWVEMKIKQSKLEQLLVKHGISLLELSRQTGITYPTLINIKNGKEIKYSKRTLIDIAKFFKVTPNQII